MVTVPVGPSSVDLVVTDLVLEPLELLEGDVAEVGGDNLDPSCDGLEVVEGGKGSVGVVVEAVWSPDSNLRRVGEGLVGGVLLGGGASRRGLAGDLEDRVLDVPGGDRIRAGKADGVVGGGPLAPFGLVFAEARAPVVSSSVGGAWGEWFVLAVPPGPVVGELQLGVVVPAVVVGGGHGGVDVVPYPVDGELHVGVHVPGVEGLGLWAGRGLDHVGAEERGEGFVVEWAGDEEHIEAIWVVRAGLLERVWDEVSGCCSSSLYTFWEEWSGLVTGLVVLFQSSLDAGVSFDRWKVSWTLHPSRSLTLYVRGPFTSTIG